jgi:hypothetical protein
VIDSRADHQLESYRAGISLNNTPPFDLSVLGVSTNVITTASIGTL